MHEDVILVPRRNNKKYYKVKRLQPINVNKWLALEALDRFFGYTGPAEFIMGQNVAPKKRD